MRAESGVTGEKCGFTDVTVSGQFIVGFSICAGDLSFNSEKNQLQH